MAEPQDYTSEIDLRRYVHALRRRWWVVAVAVVVVTGSALFVSSRQTPMYRAGAQLLLQPSLRDVALDATVSYVNPDRVLKTEMQVLRSPPVEEEVRKRLGYTAGVSATPLPETNVVLLEAVSTDPAKAAAIANTYAEAYIAVRQAQAVNELASAGQQINVKIAELQRQIDTLKAALPSSAARDQPNPAESSQLNALITQQGVLRQKLDQINIDASARSGGAQLVVPASVPSAPFSPDTRRNGLLALAVGTAMGVALVLLREFFDDSINTEEDLTRAAPGLAVLGVIPYVRRWRARGPGAISLADPSSPAAEAYRTLRTSIKFLRLDTAVRLLQVTSPSAAEGKTSTVANLGVALAMAGQRAIVVCCDLRRPRLHESFGLDNTVGLTTVVVGEAALSDALQPVPGAPGLRILASGPLPPNPAELLSTRRAAEVLSALREEADVVILDCPPLLPVTDAVVISALVDATVVVATADLTKRKQLARAVEVLRQVEAPLVGTVFNGVKAKGTSRYRYDHYGQRQSRSAKKRTSRGDREVERARGGDVTVTAEVAPTPVAVSSVSTDSTSEVSGNGQPAHVEPSASNVATTNIEEAGAGQAGGEGKREDSRHSTSDEVTDTVVPPLSTMEVTPAHPPGDEDRARSVEDAEESAITARDFPDWFKELFKAAVRGPTDDEPRHLMVADGPGIATELRETGGFEIERMVLMPGASTEPRTHRSSDVVLCTRKGTTSVRFGHHFERWEVLQLGNFCLIPASTPYKIANPSDSDWLEVMLAQRSATRPLGHRLA